MRGHVVRLGPAVDQVLARHRYPEPVARVLGEALALTALLSASLKFDGIFTLQIQADGPVSLVVADYRTGGDLRAMAKFAPEALAAADDIGWSDLLGKGHLAFTVDQGDDTERYQGIVDLVGDSLAECAQSYFRRSEQIATAISLGAGRDPAGHWRACGMLTVPAAENVIRLLPPLIIEESHVREAIEILERSATETAEAGS